MTLVDSSALEGWRASQEWDKVSKNFDLVVPFEAKDIPPHELPAKLKAAGQRIAIITSSPDWYAKEIIRRFKIVHDVLISYGDTKLHKPDPEPITKALTALGVAPKDACHVGDASIDVEASYHAGVMSIGAGWGITNYESSAPTAPDILIQTPNRMLDLASLAARGYFAEMISGGIKPAPHRGSILPCGSGPWRYALGRYFPTGDPRHARSALSRDLLVFKDTDATVPRLASALAHFFGQLKKWVPDAVVPVPPKPSQPRHRFKALLEHPSCAIPGGVRVHLDGLKCIKDITNYKKMNPAERAEAIKGAFASTRRWSDEKILLIDDVFTTGGTSMECAATLMANGAAEVRILAFARDQHSFTRKMCPACNRPMKIRKKGEKGNPFWGCSGYPDNCRHTEQI